jgi:hypothetical protein
MVWERPSVADLAILGRFMSLQLQNCNFLTFVCNMSACFDKSLVASEILTSCKYSEAHHFNSDVGCVSVPSGAQGTEESTELGRS